MTDNPQLVVNEGPEPDQTFVLEQDALTLGRDPHNNDIVISDPQVSRQHARIVRQGDLMVVEDMGSTNGTFVNGMRLTGSHALANGDVIGLGDAVTLTYYSASPAMTEPLVGRRTIPMEPSYEAPPPPPPAYAAASPPAYTTAPPDEEKKRRTGLWIGCGCLVLLIIFVCAAVFLLDYLGLLPDFFYQPLFWFGLDKYFMQ